MIFNSLQFDGDNSLDHGVYITGEAIYSAPVRDTESIEIPGRNGDFILDKGRWKNIDVTYKAGLFGSDQENFANKIRDYRNILASRIGYKRITDTYNPQEFRLGTLKDGLDVEAKSQKKAGEFDIVFECKPQRFLTSGETEIEVTSGQTITNPTPYDASPLVEVEGYGTVSVNGQNIVINNSTFGKIDIGTFVDESGDSVTMALDTTFLNIGDSIYVSGLTQSKKIGMTSFSSSDRIQRVSSSPTTSRCVMKDSHVTAQTRLFSVTMDPAYAFQYGTPGSVRVAGEFTIEYLLNGTQLSATYTMGLRAIYDGDETISIVDVSGAVPSDFEAVGSVSWKSEAPYGISTVGTAGNMFFIDFETGDIFAERNGSLVSYNRFADLGSDLLTLKPGANEVTFDDTITSLKIVPRWWIL